MRRPACLPGVRALLVGAFVSALVLSGGPLRAAEPTFARALDAYLKARTELGRFSGAVLVARGSEVLFRKGYGYADVEARRPFTPETQNEMASISKMFTAMAALMAGPPEVFLPRQVVAAPATTKAAPLPEVTAEQLVAVPA
mgnify:CR=1 FL=1